jgi:hypothetical protein
MANFYVTNSLYPDNPQLFTITIKQIVKLSGEPRTIFSKSHIAEEFWEISISTSGLSGAGTPISPIWVDVKDNEKTIDEFIAAKISELCSKIDWSQSGVFSLQQDRYAPYIEEQYPIPDQENVPIDSSIRFVLKEHLPGVGIDFNSIQLKVKDIPIIPKISGTPFNCSVTFKPKIVG